MVNASTRVTSFFGVGTVAVAVAVAVAVVVELNDEDELDMFVAVKLSFGGDGGDIPSFLDFLRANLSDTVNVDDSSTVPKCDRF